ncbi:MAG: TRAP transporter small permease [Chloroflexota bacterium]|nr:TRAP transporter small permease [Chloroflexota bacterium]
MKGAAKFSDGLEKFANNFGVVLLSALTIIIFVEVIARYGFHASSPASEEISRHLFVILGFIVAGVAWKTDSHVKIDMILKRFSDKGQYILTLIFNVFGLFTAGTWLWCAISMIKWELTLPSVTEVMEIPWIVLFSFLCLGMTILVYYIIERLVKLIRSPGHRGLETKGMSKS